MSATSCPLCFWDGQFEDLHNAGRDFFHCPSCHLLFVDRGHLPTHEEEKLRYQRHENHEHDKGYVDFLQQAIDPALRFVEETSSILDYGCGPKAVLSELLVQKGLNCSNYDPFFFPKPVQGTFDMIFSTEVFEHFHYPAKEVSKIEALLKPEGLLVVMTDMYNKSIDFASWWYARDITHTCFYQTETLEYLANQFNLEEVYNDQQKVIILRKR